MFKVLNIQVYKFAGLVVMVYLCVIQTTLQYGPDSFTNSVLQHFDRVKIPIQIIVPVSLCCRLLLHLQNRKTYRYKFAFEQLLLSINSLIGIYGSLTYVIKYENLAFCDDEEHTAIDSTITFQPLLLKSYQPAGSIFENIVFYYTLAELVIIYNKILIIYWHSYSGLPLIPIKVAKSVIIFLVQFISSPNTT